MSKKTIEIQPRSSEMVKPAEIIAIPGLENWTLSERRIWNILLKNAWDQNMEDPAAEFSIELSELRNRNEDNQDIWELLRTLATTDVQARLSSGRFVHVQMLGGREFPEENGEDGILKYEFSKYLVPILRDSEIYARMDMKVIKALRSKFSMSLYEAISQRINLHKNSQILNTKELREWLGVAPDKFLLKSGKTDWSALRRFALEPAINEVNNLTAYNVEYEPIKKGRSINKIIISWGRKEPLSPQEQAQAKEVNRHGIGRKARIKQGVEAVKEIELTQEQIQYGYDYAAKTSRLDIYAAYEDWKSYVSSLSEQPEHLVGHWLEFCKRRAKQIQ